MALQATTKGVDVEVRYLNRLSDACFVWSRDALRIAGKNETLWSPNDA